MTWSERWARRGWSLEFSNAGGRLRINDVLAGFPKSGVGRPDRVVGQAAFASTIGGAAVRDDKVALWAAVCRKVLQRGHRPPVSSRAQEVILGKLGEPFSPTESQLMRAIAGPVTPFDLAHEYLLDDTFEAPFWSALSSISPGLARWFVPQAPLEALASESVGGRSDARWVDFLYCAPWSVTPTVIEIDGAGHEARLGADHERDRALRGSRIAVRRYTGKEALDPKGPILSVAQRMAGENLDDEIDPRVLLAIHGPSIPARLGLAVVSAVVSGILRPGQSWVIDVIDEMGIAADLAGPALDPLRAISQLWACGVVPDHVVVNGRRWALAGTGATASKSNEHARVDLRIRLEPTVPYFAQLPDLSGTPEIVVRGAGVPVDLGWLVSSVPKRPLVPLDRDIDEPLHLLLADLFGHDSFREGQLPAVRRVLSGHDSVVLLPTGSGKSLIYQLAGLVTPGTTVVIDPLVSLIDDQERRLIRDGIDRVAPMHSGRMARPGERDRVLGSMARGDALFVLATPERFQSQRFRTHLETAARQRLVNFVVVDEAHCVSEWGHDFRTSYLRLARNLRKRCADTEGQAPPLLALTGTASPAVLRDVLRELEIADDPGSLLRPASHDRRNLTYDVRQVDEQSWNAALADVILEHVPSHLGVGADEMAQLRGRDTLSGIVFTPHVNGKYGALQVASALEDSLRLQGLSIETVIYSGRAPDGRESEWAKEKVESVDRFMADDVSLLVGTKAFGMGIDKPNIRYTIHAGFPSSLEAFAQEAGRAGRDGRPALCTLIAILPEPDIAHRLLAIGLDPSERKRAANGERHSADVGRQVFFLNNSFPGVDDEVRAAMGVVDNIGGASPGAKVTLPLIRAWDSYDKASRRRTEDQRSSRDRGLYRLAATGVIDDITIDGTEVTVYVADWDNRSIDRALTTYLARIEPGRVDAQRADVQAAPELPIERVEHHLRLLIGSTYQVIGRGRLQALRFMYDVASGPTDPEVVRSRINAYLGSGPTALALAEAVAAELIDVRRFVEVLSAIPVAEQQELRAGAARQLESYPEHPLMLLASALGESRLPTANENAFMSSIHEAMAQMERYGVSPEDASLGAQWLSGLLRNEHGAKHAEWMIHVLDGWERTAFSEALLAPVEAALLDEARKGTIHPSAMTRVLARRVRRHAAASVAIAHAVAGRSTRNDPEGSGRDDVE